jgi:hypothetical protein
MALAIHLARATGTSNGPSCSKSEWTKPTARILADYSQSFLVGDNPTKTALVNGGKAYFLGAYGVTVVPLDGSATTTLYPPGPGGTHAIDLFGAFTVGSGDIYVCESGLSTGTTDLGRFDPDGTWEFLFTGTLLARRRRHRQHTPRGWKPMNADSALQCPLRVGAVPLPTPALQCGLRSGAAPRTASLRRRPSGRADVSGRDAKSSKDEDAR